DAVPRGDLVERGLLDRAARLVVRGGALAPALEPAQVEQPFRVGLGRCQLERLCRSRTQCVARLRLLDQATCRLGPALEGVRQARPVAELEDEFSSRGAE